MHATPHPPLREALREGTDARHRALEALPFMEGLSRGAVEPAAWLGYLEAMRAVYRTLDELRPEGVPPFPLDALEADLRARSIRLGEAAAHPPPPAGFAPVARVRAQLLAHRLRGYAREDPEALLGAFYVLEGAGLGARVIGEATRAAGWESRWLTTLAARGPAAWRVLLDRLETPPGSEDAELRAVEGARSVFDAMARVIQALDPLLTEVEADLSSELNPHAGGHPVAAHEGVLEAALRAGERSWLRWPYYAHRYGERGRAFTRSDSAWLATLAGMPREFAMEQVVWLADLLTSRGMPRRLMEDHLGILHEELQGVPAPGEARSARAEAALPGSAPAHSAADPHDPWAYLDQAARLLRARRTAWITERAAQATALRFDRRVPAEESAPLPGTGLLLASALADEADGLPRAVSALEDWLTDQARFSPAWVAEVQRAVRAGRRRLRRRAEGSLPGG
jgi:heme oxygenase